MLQGGDQGGEREHRAPRQRGDSIKNKQSQPATRRTAFSHASENPQQDLVVAIRSPRKSCNRAKSRKQDKKETSQTSATGDGGGLHGLHRDAKRQRQNLVPFRSKPENDTRRWRGTAFDKWLIDSLGLLLHSASLWRDGNALEYTHWRARCAILQVSVPASSTRTAVDVSVAPAADAAVVVVAGQTSALFDGTMAAQCTAGRVNTLFNRLCSSRFAQTRLDALLGVRCHRPADGAARGGEAVQCPPQRRGGDGGDGGGDAVQIDRAHKTSNSKNFMKLPANFTNG